MWRHFPLLKLWLRLTFNKWPMPELTHLIQWKLGWQIGNNRVDAAVVLVVVAAMTVTIIVADEDNVGINLTTLQDEVVAATPLTVVGTPLLRSEEVTPKTTGIFVGAEPTNFAVPQPSFGRSC